MFSEQLSEQQKEDGITLRERLAEPQVWAALERIMSKVESDIFEDFVRSKEKKSWLRGARAVAKTLLPTIRQKIEDAINAQAEEDQDQKILRGESAEGSSDLAI